MRIQTIQCTRCKTKYFLGGEHEQRQLRIELQEIAPLDFQEAKPVSIERADLCPGCIQALRDWITNKTAVGQLPT